VNTMRLEPAQGEGVVERYGRYRLRGILGQGGMGRLYVAEESDGDASGRIVALKRILPHLADSPHFRDMFLREARVVARLKHNNIVATHEFGEIEGSYFVSMEYLPGEDLAAVWERCRTGPPMPVPVAMAMIEQAATGLHYAHEVRDSGGRPLGLVHRDVNPANLFVTYDGVVKLLDFGIAKNSSAPQRTAPGIFKGTYGYCAPEQVVGGTVDRQTDVFCLGIVFWELLTGRQLFDDGNQVTTIDAVRSRRIEAPSALRPDVPAEVDAIALRALDRDRRKRYVSAHQMVGELRALSRQLPMPSSKELGAWLGKLFGEERVALKRLIAQGRDVEPALARLGNLSPQSQRESHRSSGGKSPSLVEPRAIWSTHLPARSTSEMKRSTGRIPAVVLTPPPGERPAQRKRLVAIAALAIGLGAGMAFVSLRRSAPAPAGAEPLGTGTLTIRSRPAGAHVLVDGNPSGLSTPATLQGLPVGRSVELRLDKAGYTTASRRITVTAGASAHDFELAEATGTLRFEGLPPAATIFVDDSQAEGLGPLSLAIGPHRVRVETPGDVLFTGEMQIQRGEQTVRIAPARKGP
jgi:serine/threonine protein kinase